MAVQRQRPYAQFNFLVDLGTGVTDGPQAGFQECSEIGMSVDGKSECLLEFPHILYHRPCAPMCCKWPISSSSNW